MPKRPTQPDPPELTVKHIYKLITGRQWHFDIEPPFPDDQAALACYRRIRHLLLPWTKDNLNGGLPWAEGAVLRRTMKPITTKDHGFTYESCRQFLAMYYREIGKDVTQSGTVAGS